MPLWQFIAPDQDFARSGLWLLRTAPFCATFAVLGIPALIWLWNRGVALAVQQGLAWHGWFVDGSWLPDDPVGVTMLLVMLGLRASITLALASFFLTLWFLRDRAVSRWLPVVVGIAGVALLTHGLDRRAEIILTVTPPPSRTPIRCGTGLIGGQYAFYYEKVAPLTAPYEHVAGLGLGLALLGALPLGCGLVRAVGRRLWPVASRLPMKHPPAGDPPDV